MDPRAWVDSASAMFQVFLRKTYSFAGGNDAVQALFGPEQLLLPEKWNIRSFASGGAEAQSRLQRYRWRYASNMPDHFPELQLVRCGTFRAEMAINKISAAETSYCRTGLLWEPPGQRA